MNRHRRCTALASLLALALLPGLWAQEEWETWEGWEGFSSYDLSMSTILVPSPTGTNTLNCLLPENSGGYVAVWDEPTGPLVERRDASSVRLWSWVPPEPLPAEQETTRIVLASRTHTLWCSADRWFFLSKTNGAVSRNGLWTLPYLDPSRVIIQDDKLHVLYGSNASVYDTNMEFQGTLTTAFPSGYWRAYGGSWLVDMQSRESHAIRLCTLATNLQVTSTFAVALPTELTGGYVEHRVLGAEPSRILIVSSLNWPTRTFFYYTLVRSDGTVGFQHFMNHNQVLTGAAPIADGWLLSARNLGVTEPRHTLYRVDDYGRPRWQVGIDLGGSRQYVVVNSNPIRLLYLNGTTTIATRGVRLKPWYESWSKIIWPPTTYVTAFDVSSLRSVTNHFWMEPVRFNNS